MDVVNRFTNLYVPLKTRNFDVVCEDLNRVHRTQDGICLLDVVNRFTNF